MFGFLCAVWLPFAGTTPIKLGISVFYDIDFLFHISKKYVFILYACLDFLICFFLKLTILGVVCIAQFIENRFLKNIHVYFICMTWFFLINCFLKIYHLRAGLVCTIYLFIFEKWILEKWFSKMGFIWTCLA